MSVDEKDRSYKPWTVIPWDSPERTLPLIPEELIQIDDPVGVASSAGFLGHADIAYVASRVLLLGTRTTQHLGLYMAAQVVEKYLKAILCQDPSRLPRRSHKLSELALLVARTHPEFGDAAFVGLCERLEPLDKAGRYPDVPLAGWRFSLTLITFLDEFVVRCRRILIGPSGGTYNWIRAAAWNDPYGFVARLLSERSVHYRELINDFPPASALHVQRY